MPADEPGTLNLKASRASRLRGLRDAAAVLARDYAPACRRGEKEKLAEYEGVIPDVWREAKRLLPWSFTATLPDPDDEHAPKGMPGIDTPERAGRSPDFAALQWSRVAEAAGEALAGELKKNKPDEASESVTDRLRRDPDAARLAAAPLHRMAELDRRWRREYGEPLPLDLASVKRLAVRAGVAGERAFDAGEWQGADIWPIIEGYLQRRKDAGGEAEGARGEAVEAEAAEAELQPDGPAPGTPEARALAILIENPEWTDTKIAKEAGCARTSLYRFEQYRAAREMQKQGKAERPRGSKDADGNIEAWE